MMRQTTLQLNNDTLNFAASHFTIFSENERERLHGHNYHVSATFTTLIDHTGIRFDYRHYQQKLKTICLSLDFYMLLPEHSPYLKINSVGEYYEVYFAKEKLIFLKKDTKILPISNTTVEELSHYILQQLIADQADIEKNLIQGMTISVSASPGKSAMSEWKL